MPNTKCKIPNKNLRVLETFTPLSCQCGSLDHQLPSHPICPLNINNINVINNKACKCGSYSHKTRRSKDCPLNVRLTRNAHINKISSLEDLNDLENPNLDIQEEW